MIAEAARDLFGTTTGVSPVTGAQIGDGTVFELSGTGFGVPVAFAVDDLTTGVQSLSAGTPYTGPVAGLVDQYINTSSDNLNVAALVANMFIRTGSSQGGSGEDAIDVSAVGGTNVLDGEVVNAAEALGWSAESIHVHFLWMGFCYSSFLSLVWQPQCVPRSHG